MDLGKCNKCGCACTKEHLKKNGGKCWLCNDNKSFGKKVDKTKIKPRGPKTDMQTTPPQVFR